MVAAAHIIAASSSSGNFLVKPNVGVMVWTLIAFGITLLLLQRLAFPRIGKALDRRQRAIEESIDAADRTKSEADKLLEEYRERLREARNQADQIVARARQAAEVAERNAHERAHEDRDEIMRQTRRDIETETRRAIAEIRAEVADLTVQATEKITRKTLDDDDQRRLVEEALNELDFSGLSGEGRQN